MNRLRVGGLTPLTTIDYPGELAAVVFCQGCPWRCRYCQNSELLTASADVHMDWNEVLAFLRRRRGLLDAVVFSGGEPTLQRGLAGAIADARGLGFKIGLHTAGCYPERLRKLLPVIDWIGLDIKTVPDHYDDLTTVAGSSAAAWASLEHVLASGSAYEIRVTVDPELLPGVRVETLLRRLARAGVKHLALQRCRTGTHEQSMAVGELPIILPEQSALFEHLSLR